MVQDDKSNEVELDHRLEPPHGGTAILKEPNLSDPSKTQTTISSPIQSTNKKRKLMFIGLIVGVFILLAGAGATAYYAFYLPNTPQNVVRQALANEFSQESIKNSAKISGELKIQGSDGNMASVNFTISQDKADGLALNVKAYGITADVVTKDGKTLYIKLGGLSGLDKLLEQYGENLPIEQFDGLLERLTPLLTKLNNQWYEIDSGVLGSAGELNSVNDNLGDISQSDIDKIMDIYLDNEFLVVDNKGAHADINGKSATQYYLHFDGRKLKSFVSELKSANIQGVEITDDMVTQISEFVDKNDLSKHPFSLWIDEDNNIVRITYLHQYGLTKVELTLTASDIGSDIKIETPTNTKNILELLTDVQPLIQNLDSGSSI